MALSFNEEITLRATLMSVKQERKDSLRNRFAGTQLQPKGRVQDAATLAQEANHCQKAVRKLKEGFSLWVRKTTGAAPTDERAKTHRHIGG